MTATFEQAPTAIHRGESELPFVDIGDGSTLQLLQVDLAAAERHGDLGTGDVRAPPQAAVHR